MDDNDTALFAHDLADEPVESDPPGLRGRHRSHQGPARPHRLTPRFSDVELAAVEAAAASVGATANGFVADAAVAAARGSKLTLTDARRREDLVRLQRELFQARTAVNRVGANLNQALATWPATDTKPPWLATAVSLAARVVRRLDKVVAQIDRRLQP